MTKVRVDFGNRILEAAIDEYTLSCLTSPSPHAQHLGRLRAVYLACQGEPESWQEEVEERITREEPGISVDILEGEG